MEHNLTQVTCSQQQIESQLKEYFGSHLTHLHVFMSGRIAMISVKYTDFKPVRMVQLHIISSFPNALLHEIERNFSEAARKDIERTLETTEIYIKEDDGTMRATDLLMLEEEAMFNTEIA